ncbi:MAG: hypothetical protein DWQ01_07150 [Planctomycetota bacterium]|nr:MAG: hypothetical protein DWQ01_07150 [Planctomycetota bacterium]
MTIKPFQTLSLLLLLPANLLAQDTDPVHQPKPVKVTLFGELMPKNNLDGNAAEFGSLKSGISLGALVPLAGREQILKIGATGIYRSYDWENISPDPFDSASTHAGLRVNYINLAADHLYWNIFSSVASGLESGAKFGDSLAWGGGAGLGYVFNDDLRLGIGIGVQDRLEDDLFFYPIPLVNWQIAEAWRLYSSDDLDSGLSLGWRSSAELEFDLTAGLDFFQFRLNDTGAFPNGAVFDQRKRIGLGLRWTVAEDTELRIAVGRFFGQEYEVRAPNGSLLAEYEVESNPYLFAALSFRF